MRYGTGESIRGVLHPSCRRRFPFQGIRKWHSACDLCPFPFKFAPVGAEEFPEGSAGAREEELCGRKGRSVTVGGLFGCPGSAPRGLPGCAVAVVPATVVPATMLTPLAAPRTPFARLLLQISSVAALKGLNLTPTFPCAA